MKKPIRKLDAIGLLVAGALTGAAVQKELSKPAGERTWQGRVGFVPYDFRPPSPGRLRSSFWDPDGTLIAPQPFGVGWTVNAGRASRLVKAKRG